MCRLNKQAGSCCAWGSSLLPSPDSSRAQLLGLPGPVRTTSYTTQESCFPEDRRLPCSCCVASSLSTNFADSKHFLTESPKGWSVAWWESMYLA